MMGWDCGAGGVGGDGLLRLLVGTDEWKIDGWVRGVMRVTGRW